ncbi:MAG: sulfotransferase domain-containing protein, partial [Symploca sp. SIO2C1]|nr:sulfotransferase domain-containing protein [Symploca sp. SIO2C1]
MNKPNFFIAGAPKCGTTAMAEYLRRHPNIFMSLPKEPHYFAEDFPKIRSIQTLKQYMELFNQVTPEHLIVGEASTTYLYSSVALKNIYQFNQDAKILVMLRNPVDLVYSLHSHHLYNGFEAEKNFKIAWKMQDLRRNGLSIPKTCREPEKLQYKQVALLGAQIEKLLAIFPPQQVKIVLFDDFLVSPKAVYEEILSFMNIPSDGRLEFPKINESKTYKLEWLG